MTMTSKVKPYKFGFGPFAPEVYRMPFGDAEYFKKFLINHVAPESVAAVLVEPVQGEGGFISPPADFFPKVAEICREHDILFIVDEIQSGMGRTGKMFAIEHWNVVPDVVLSAKSLAAGMPLGAVIGRKEVMDAPHVGGLGGTYGGNPVVCRAALAVLEIIEEENLLEKSIILGQKIKERFLAWQNEFEIVGSVHGLGAMLAFDLIKNKETQEPAKEYASKLIGLCHEKGLVLLSCGAYGNSIRVLMPLAIPDDLLERGLAIIEKSLQEING